MGSGKKQKLNMSISHGDALPASVLDIQMAEMLDRAAKSDKGIILCDHANKVDVLSYQDLLLAASSILRGLRSKGLQPQEKVILQLQNPRYFFASLWACWLGGFVPIPLGIDLVVEDVSQSKLYQTWELCDCPLIIVGVVREQSLREIAIANLLNHPPDYNYHHADVDDLALLLFTSGSTGKPKGVMLSQRNLIASVYGMAKVNNLSQDDITLNWMPLEHVASLVMFHLTEVYLGCQQIQVNSELVLQTPLQWLNLIDQYRVTATWSPNFAYNLVNERLNNTKHDWDLSCLRWMGNGAEAVVGKTAGRFLELLSLYGLNPTVVSPGYGMSETTSGICHSNNFYNNKNRDFVSVGAPIPGVSLRIVNEENQVIPEGKIGLLQVKGETVTAGYFKQPLEEVFIDDWFNTGDLGFIELGRLTITGRQKDVIIINGVNYYNHDLETVVEEIPEVTVSFTAACSVIDSQQQEQVAIFFNTEMKSDSLRELINTIRRNVFNQTGVSPRYIIPVTKETIPKTAIGKVMRSQLSKKFKEGEFNSVIAKIDDLFNQRNLNQQELPGNAIEQKLVTVWREVLNLTKVGVKDNFFELGGNSLLLMEVLSKLAPEYNISAVTLFQYPTISALAKHLGNDEDSIALQQGKRRGELRRKTGNKDVAIIGMSCRFPGANNINQFWDNLCNGIESISFFEDDEMINSGVKKELINNPNYVKASPILEDIEGFDADFWEFTPKEAQLLDPQQRLFLECAWESLEDAGYDPFNYQGDISLYGGAATNTYLLNNIYPNRHSIDEQDSLQVLNLSSMGGFQVSTANDKDYLTTRTSYKLNLTGSSVNVQTACSTSLVTVHLACQSLINAECDIALAGGVSVHSPQKMGYLYQEGMILSPDGHCRAFDADAAGTIFGSGAGMVVLKLLDNAIESGDRIYGIIKGSAVNNDGGAKVGYFAPNVDGQTRVIAEALTVADISPETVGYIEAHGTGTKLGDPIEVTALSQAYGQNIEKTGFCGIGSVKTNVGHLQMASGIVGLIKTTLCLYHQQIPASLHFSNPSPQIDFEHSPFYINTQLQDWISNYPRRAGVNSLGIGGTNAHVVLEEFVDSKETIDKSLPAYLLTLSAKNETALQELATSYQNHVEVVREQPYAKRYPLELRDICFTSNIGRHHFDYRCAVVAKDKQDLINQLSNISIDNIQHNNKLAFLFTGQGSQYVGMAQQLYYICDVFKENCDRCWEILRSHIDVDGVFIDIDKTQYAQPLLFITEYSLAQMWISWGIKPDVMMGHSIGEYVAATIAGVFSLEDALKLVSARGKLMGSLPEDGAMLAVFSEEVLDYLSDVERSGANPLEQRCKDIEKDSISIAAENGTHIVLSGFKKDIDRINQELINLEIKTQLLNVSHGFHSLLMQPIIEDFKTVANTVTYSIPNIPIISNLTGELANENIATANYWIEHILQPVQFAKSINYLDRQQVNIFLEVGTKPILRGIAESILDNKLCLHTLDENKEDWKSILSSLSQLYIKGIDINWLAVSENYHGNKISLPTYPFQRQRYWFDIPQETISTEPNKDRAIHPLLGHQINSPLKQDIFQSNIESETINWLQDHRLKDKAVFPGTAYIEIAISLSAWLRNTLGLLQFKNLPLSIKDINITTPLYIDGKTEIQLIASPKEKYINWEIYSLNNDQWKLHANGKISSSSKTVTSEKLEFIKSKFSNNINVEQHYLSCQQKEINYGKRFQGIKELYAEDNQALGLVELPDNLESEQYNFHPALLDSCLQIIFASLPAELQKTTYIPVGLDRFYLYSIPNKKVWSYLKLKPASNNKILIADVWLYKENGELIAKLEGLKSQAIKSQPAWHNCLYQPQWKPQPLLTQSSLSNTGSWLIFADSKNIGKQVATKLISQNQECHIFTRDQIKDNPQAFQNLIQQHPNLTGAIYFWSLNDMENWEECKSYLYLVQALIQYVDNPSLYFITHNAQPVNNHQTISGIKNSTLWGLQKAIALENPELFCIGIDIDSLHNQADIIFQEICTKNNEQVAYRNNQRYVNRLARYEKTETLSNSESNKQLYINNPGNLDSLEWKSVTRQQPEDNEIEIEVKATGLNFRDVMVALDLYPDETKFLGLECAGMVISVGKEVANFQPGDEVMAIADSSFSQYLNVNSLLAIHKPEFLSFEAAATMPVAFLTAFYTLVHQAQLQPGEKILIHSAAGGVGMAAIQIAQNIGAEIYATASTPKWELLKSMGVNNIMNSRSLDFAEEIMSATNNQGVDVVLNSLSGEFISKSIEVLNDHGRFIEIGKQGVWTKEDVAQVKSDVSYSIVDLWQITQDNPGLIQQIFVELEPPIVSGMLLEPLSYKVFANNQIIDAFRYMQQGKHQGKIIISMDSQNQFDISTKGYSPTTSTPTYKGTYLITGGMGAIGLKVAQWLTTKGVTNIVLVGRSDIKPEYEDGLKQIQKNAQVNLIKADIADIDQLAQVLKQIESTLPPLRGVIHCAGITRDRTIIKQDWNSFKSVLAPKVQGAWNLHNLTQEYDLENFIMFSSAASLIGSSGQANYCAANAFLDTLAYARRSLGLPAISINWSAWKNTGLASNSGIIEGLKQKGIDPIKPHQGIEILEHLLTNNFTQMGVIPIDWNVWIKNNLISPYYQDLVLTQNVSKNNNDSKQQLLDAIPEQREYLLIEQISQQVGNILGIKDISNIDLELGFSELGLDSLGSVELRNKLQSSYDTKLSQTAIFDYSNIRQLAKHLFSLLFETQVLEDNKVQTKVISIEKLSEIEAEAILLEELEKIDYE